MGLMENRQGRFYALGVPVLGQSMRPVLLIGTDQHFTVDKAALIGLDAACNNVAYHKGCRKYHQRFGSNDIAIYHPANGNCGTRYIAFHPRALANHHPASGHYISPDAAVYTSKAGGFNIALKTGIWPYNCVD